MSSPSTPAAPKFSPASFTALDPNSLQYTSPSQANQLATQYDQTAYNASDADLAARHPGLVAANRINESNVLSDVQGNAPAGLQAQLVNAGLSTPAASFGGFGASIVPGSAGQFGVARNLGINYEQYRGGVNNELAQLNQQDPARQIGLSGQSALQVMLANSALRNSVLEGNFQGQNQVAISNATGQNSSAQGGFAGALSAQAAAQANQTAQINAGIQAASLLAGAYGKYAGSSSGSSTAGAGNTYNFSSGSPNYGYTGTYPAGNFSGSG